MLVRPAAADLTIEITQGVDGALPIAVVPFALSGSTEADTFVTSIINADLARSGRFTPLPGRDLLAQPHRASDVDYRTWRTINVEGLVVGRIRVEAGVYNIQFELFDIVRGVQMKGYTVKAATRDLRQTAHQISDLIYEAYLGEKGAFATHIAYVTEIRGKQGKRYSLQVADADGFNPKTVLDSVQPLMSPAWSPDGKKLAYVSFENQRPNIYIQELATGTRSLVSSFPGLNGAPAWSPDGKRMALVLSQTSGNADIYIMNLETRQLSRLTDNYAIDTEPVWTPDGAAVLFTSDRGGGPQLYRVASSGGTPERLTFDGSYNARAAIAPNGRTVAFVHGEGNVYRIAVLDLETGSVQVLTDSRLDESPSFAPNGSMILYATNDKGRGVMCAVSVDGKVRQRLALQEGDTREPAWSPYKK